MWSGPKEAEKDIRFTAVRENGLTIYKIALPLASFGMTEDLLTSGGVKVSVKVDDSDGEGRDLWMGLEDTVPFVFTK